MKIETVLDPLTMHEAQYPDNFSMDHLKMLPSFRERVSYVAKHLNRFGSGSSRSVFLIDQDTVLKVAKNKAGLAQNQSESTPAIQKYGIIARVLDSDKEHIFLEMERATTLVEGTYDKTFKEALGYTLKDVEQHLTNVYLLEKYPDKPLRNPLPDDVLAIINRSPWMRQLIALIQEFDFVYPGDFAKGDSYGIVHRNGKNRLVLIDYGFTNSVWRDHYANMLNTQPGDYHTYQNL